MGKPTGFLELAREEQPVRPVHVRRRDFREVYSAADPRTLQRQGARCMDCGIPFCHQGCPLGNLVPDWNDMVYRDQWTAAVHRLHATNNFPEFTGRLCPAPCEGACVLGINADPVNIKSVELGIAEFGFASGTITARPPAHRTGKRVAVVGSGPAGLAAADQLNQAGHQVTVYERADRPGGLLRYGIPDFKMEKSVLDRRLNLLQQEGVAFEVNAEVGGNVPLTHVREHADAILLAGGSEQPRDIAVPGRDLQGIHWAMDYLTQQNRRVAGDGESSAAIHAAGKRVVILGGGDTGADCLGTAHRQGAQSVVQVEISPCPPNERAADNPWPQWPRILRVSAAHQEGGERLYSVTTLEFVGNSSGQISHLRAHDRNRDAPMQIDCDLVLIAAGFLGPHTDSPLLGQLGVRRTPQTTVWRDAHGMTSVPGVFAAGDMQRGQSLIVWAIADGRTAAQGIHRYLVGKTSG